MGEGQDVRPENSHTPDPTVEVQVAIDEVSRSSAGRTLQVHPIQHRRWQSSSILVLATRKSPGRCGRKTVIMTAFPRTVRLFQMITEPV